MTDLTSSIAVSYPSGFRVDARIDVEAGATTALLGPNGAGKSTIVAALAGLKPLEDGFIRLGARVLDDPAAGVFVPAEDRRVGVMFQDTLLFPRMTVRQNIEFGPRSLRMEATRAQRVVATWIERLDLGSLVDRYPHQLSGGASQRVAIARTMAIEPDMLVLDEPLAAIDISTRARIRRDLAAFLDAFEGPAVVITHDPAGAFLLADDIIILEDGRVTHAGTPDDLRMRPRTSYAADLAGVNLVIGSATAGAVDVGAITIWIPDTSVSGEVVATIHPRAIALHRERPEGSARNVWKTQVRGVEDHGDTVRVATGLPLELTAEVTSSGAAAIGVAPGAPLWVSIKATEISVRALGDDDADKSSESSPTGTR